MRGHKPIRYIKKGSIIEVKEETLVEKKFLGLFPYKSKSKKIVEYEVIKKRNEFEVTIQVELKNIVTGDLKTIEVSPDRYFWYRVIEKL